MLVDAACGFAEGEGGIVFRSASGRFLGIVPKNPWSVDCFAAVFVIAMTGFAFNTVELRLPLLSLSEHWPLTTTRGTWTRSGVAARIHVGDEDPGVSSGSNSGSGGGVSSLLEDGGEDTGAGEESNKKEEEEVGPRRVLPYVRRTVGLNVSSTCGCTKHSPPRL